MPGCPDAWMWFGVMTSDHRCSTSYLFENGYNIESKYSWCTWREARRTSHRSLIRSTQCILLFSVGAGILRFPCIYHEERRSSCHLFQPLFQVFQDASIVHDRQPMQGCYHYPNYDVLPNRHQTPDTRHQTDYSLPDCISDILFINLFYYFFTCVCTSTLIYKYCDELRIQISCNRWITSVVISTILTTIHYAYKQCIKITIFSCCSRSIDHTLVTHALRPIDEQFWSTLIYFN